MAPNYRVTITPRHAGDQDIARVTIRHAGISRGATVDVQLFPVEGETVADQDARILAIAKRDLREILENWPG